MVVDYSFDWSFVRSLSYKVYTAKTNSSPLKTGWLEDFLIFWGRPMFQRKAVQRFWHHCQLDEVPVPGPTRFPSVATFVAARPQLLVCERMGASQ